MLFAKSQRGSFAACKDVDSIRNVLIPADGLMDDAQLGG
jgi:hypothetical protein